MSKDLLISMLRKGQNGDEILAILDTITNEQETEPTLEEIKFWVTPGELAHDPLRFSRFCFIL